MHGGLVHKEEQCPEKEILRRKIFYQIRLFSVICNGALFGGEQILRPDELKQLNGETALLVPDKQGKKKTEKSMESEPGTASDA